MNRSTFRYTTDQRTGHQGDDWRDRSACRDEDPELFFSIGDGPAAQRQDEQAKAVCRRCPVKDECLTWATEAGISDGVWGETTPDERRAIRDEQRRMAGARR